MHHRLREIATSFPGLRARELERDSMPVPAPPSP